MKTNLFIALLLSVLIISCNDSSKEQNEKIEQLTLEIRELKNLIIEQQNDSSFKIVPDAVETPLQKTKIALVDSLSSDSVTLKITEKQKPSTVKKEIKPEKKKEKPVEKPIIPQYQIPKDNTYYYYSDGKLSVKKLLL